MSTVIDPPQAAARPTTPAPPPVVADVETQLMHSYRVSSPVDAGSVVAAVANGAGDVEVFSLGSDGTIWNWYPDSTSSSGYSGVSLKLEASTFAVGRTSDGKVVVFYASVKQLRYVVETPGAAARWSAPRTVTYPPVPEATRIGAIYIDDIGDELYIGVLVEYLSLGRTLYKLEWATWDPAGPDFRKTSLTLESLDCVWLGNNAQTAAFACLHQIIIAYEIHSATKTKYPMQGTFDAISVAAATDAVGNSQIFAVLDNGIANHLVGGGATGKPYAWKAISDALGFRQIAAVADDAGAVHAFAVAGDNRLYHWRPETTSPTGFSNPAPITTAVATIAVASDDDGAIDLFAVGSAQSTLEHLFQEETSGNWSTVEVAVSQEGQLEEIVSYTSDVALTNAAGAPLSHQAVTLACAEEVYVTVNGSVFFIGPHRPARTATNAAGVLSIAQPTGSLAVPTVAVGVPGLIPGTIVIEQYAGVQQQLKQTTGPDLMTTKLPDGEYLLADKYRNTQTTDGLASAFQKCMSLTGGGAAQAAPLAGRHRSNTGVSMLLGGGSVSNLHVLAAPDVEQHWRLGFSEDGVEYEELTEQGARALLTEWRATTLSSRGVLDWLGDIGDLIAGAVEGVIDIIDAVVTTVVEGVKAVFRFVIDGINYVFEHIVRFVEEAFDVVEAIFAAVKVFFEKLFEWLGFLFDWPDILRTHQALAYTVDQYLGFLEGAVSAIQGIVDGGLVTLKGEIDTLFQQAIAEIAGSSSLGSYNKANTPPAPQFSEATANNVVYNATVDNAKSARPSGALVALDTSPFDAVISALETFAQNVSNEPAFSQALDYFTHLGGTPDEIFRQLLSGLMLVAEGVLDVMIDGVQAIVDAVLGVVAALIAQLRQTLNAQWSIPVVSQLYSAITDGSKLTLLDLMALIAAIPTTIVYKVVHGASPFPDSASVQAFESSFDAASMLHAAGFGPPSSTALATTGSGGLLPPQWASLMAVGGGVCTFFAGAFTAVLDAWPAESPSLLNKATYGLSCFSQGCSLPWWTSSAAPDCTTQDGKQATLWIVGCVGLLIDGVALVVEDRLPPQWDDAGCVVTFCFGVGHLATAIVASIGEGAVTIAGNIVPVIPELSKLLRLKSVVAATEGISLAVLAAIDALFYTASAVLTAISTDATTANALAPALVAV